MSVNKNSIDVSWELVSAHYMIEENLLNDSNVFSELRAEIKGANVVFETEFDLLDELPDYFIKALNVLNSNNINYKVVVDNKVARIYVKKNVLIQSDIIKIFEISINHF
jgi:hypothetical protein